MGFSNTTGRNKNDPKQRKCSTAKIPQKTIWLQAEFDVLTDYVKYINYIISTSYAAFVKFFRFILSYLGKTQEASQSHLSRLTARCFQISLVNKSVFVVFISKIICRINIHEQWSINFVVGFARHCCWYRQSQNTVLLLKIFIEWLNKSQSIQRKMSCEKAATLSINMSAWLHFQRHHFFVLILHNRIRSIFQTIHDFFLESINMTNNVDMSD